MSNRNEKSLIQKGLEAISKGDARGLKKHIKEALLAKVKRALDKREKQLAKEYFSEKK